MFDRILAFLKDIPAGADRDKPPGAEDPRVAAAALMYHVMDADGVRQDAEWERMKAILSESYGLSGDALDKLVTAGGEADEDAVDLYTFTSVLKRHLEKFGENMFLTQTPDERVYAIKPMNCPGHIQVFNQGLRSYRDLPYRIAEFGTKRLEPRLGAGVVEHLAVLDERTDPIGLPPLGDGAGEMGHDLVDARR